MFRVFAFYYGRFSGNAIAPVVASVYHLRDRRRVGRRRFL
jgi:hypothetical protein